MRTLALTAPENLPFLPQKGSTIHVYSSQNEQIFLNVLHIRILWYLSFITYGFISSTRSLKLRN